MRLERANASSVNTIARVAEPLASLHPRRVDSWMALALTLLANVPAGSLELVARVRPRRVTM